MEKLKQDRIHIITKVKANLLNIIGLVNQIENSLNINLKTATSSISAIIGNSIKNALDKGDYTTKEDIDWVVSALDGLYRIFVDYTYDSFGFHQSASKIFDSLEEVFKLNEQLRSLNKS